MLYQSAGFRAGPEQWRNRSPETSDREIFADVSGKKRHGKNGKGVNIERKRGKIVKGKRGGKLEMEVGKVIKRGEDQFVLGLPKWEFSTGKKHFTPGKKSGKMTFPLRKICLLRPWPRAVKAVSLAGQVGRAPAECMFHGKVHIFELASGEVSERCKIAGKARSSLIPPDSATSSERFLNFDRGPVGPRTLQIPRLICQFSYFLNVTEALLSVFHRRCIISFCNKV